MLGRSGRQEGSGGRGESVSIFRHILKSICFHRGQHPYESKLPPKDWSRIKQYMGVRDDQAEDCGFQDKGEIEAVRSYIFSHGKYGLKQVCLYLQHLNSI